MNLAILLCLVIRYKYLASENIEEKNLTNKILGKLWLEPH